MPPHSITTDIIAGITIVGCFILLGIGIHDPSIIAVILMVSAFYFGKVAGKSDWMNGHLPEKQPCPTPGSESKPLSTR